MPRRLVLGMVDDVAMNGSYIDYPFNFEHNQLNSLSINVGGRQIPSTPFTPDFISLGGFGYVRSYMSLFYGTGINYSDKGIDISREDYRGGYTLWAFDLTPDGCESTVSDITGGSLSIDIRFQRALRTTVDLVVYAEFDDVIEVDKNRTVYANF